MTENEIMNCLRAAGTECRNQSKTKVSCILAKNPQGDYAAVYYGEAIIVTLEMDINQTNGKVLFGTDGLISTFLAGDTAAGTRVRQPIPYLAMTSVKRRGSNLHFAFADGSSLDAWFGGFAEDTAYILNRLLEFIAGKRAEEKKFAEFSKTEQEKTLKLYRQAKKAYAEKSYDKAASLLDQAMTCHLAKAEYLTGIGYLTGHGRAQNRGKAREFFERSSLHGYGYAALQLAYGCYKGEEPYEKDDSKAVDLMLMAEGRDRRISDFYGEKVYSESAYLKGDYAECVRILEGCRDVWDAENCYRYAECYFNGKGKPQDYEKAVFWYSKALEKAPGFYAAVYRLGLCYENGWGVEKDSDRSLKLYGMACSFHDDARKHLLALGREAENAGDTKAAEKYYTLLAECGIAEGQYRLGKLYYEKNHDSVLAQDLFLSAARRNYVDAMLAYAGCLERGDGGLVNYEEAGEWYLKAYTKGSREAKAALDRMRRQIADGKIELNVPFARMNKQHIMCIKAEGITGDGRMAEAGLPAPYKPAARGSEMFTRIPAPDPEQEGIRLAGEKDADDVVALEKIVPSIEPSGLPAGKNVKVKHFEIPRWASAAIMALLVIVVAIKAVTAARDLKAAHDSLIPYEAEELNGHYYYLYDDASTWANARYLCESKGGHLATITSEEENEVILDYLDNYGTKAVFIGLYNTGYMYDPKWQWVTGETFDFADWGSGEPNADNGGLEFYVDIFNGAWNDCLYTGGETNYYLCEWDSDDTTSKTSDHFEYNGHYYRIYQDCDGWDGVRQEAEDVGGYLACITTEEENTAVRGYCRSRGIYTAYIGLYNSGENSADLQFSWVNGEPVEYTDWLEGQPNNGDDGIQLYGMYDKTGYWNDVDNVGTNFFIIEWDSEEDIHEEE